MPKQNLQQWGLILAFNVNEKISWREKYCTISFPPQSSWLWVIGTSLYVKT
jgi:hypothetical protein